MTTCRTLLLFGLVLSLSVGKAQVFNASSNVSDRHVDVDWSLDVDPCMLTPSGDQYDRMRLKVLADGTEVYEEILEESDLEPFYGAPQPTFTNVVQSPRRTDFDLYPGGAYQSQSNFTIELWSRIIDLAGTTYQLYGDGDNVLWYFSFLNELYFFQNSTGIIIKVADLSVGQDWFHLAIVNDADANEIEVYIDGNVLGVVDGYAFSSPAGFLYKDPAGTTSGGAAKQVSEIRIWDRVRLPAEIAANYLFEPPLSQTNLISRWQAQPATTYGWSSDLATSYDNENNSIFTRTPSQTSPQFTIQPYVPTFDYQPLTGTYRDVVGPDSTKAYTLELNFGPFGQVEADCSGLLATGSTLQLQAPLQQATTFKPYDIDLLMTNRSDLAASYDLYRDDTVLLTTFAGPFDVGQTMTYTDRYDDEDDQSIRSDVDHSYQLRMVNSIDQSVELFTPFEGNLRESGLQLTDQDTAVGIVWDFSPDNANFEIWRDDRRLAVVDGTVNDYVDVKPIRGDQVRYDIRTVVNDDVLMIYTDTISLQPHGVIAGEVISLDRGIPIAGVTVSATRSSSGAIFAAVTDSLGYFTIDEVSFGLIDSFEITAALANHTFVYPTPMVTLSLNDPRLDAVVVLDSTLFTTGSAAIDIINWQASSVADQDRIDLTWVATSTVPDPIVEVLRDGVTIFRQKGDNYLSHSIEDGSGVPSKTSSLTLRVISQDGADLTIADTTILHDYPAISMLSPSQVQAVPQQVAGVNTGLASITWTELSANIDGHKVYRDGTLIAEIAKGADSYTDDRLPYGQDVVYTVAKVRIVDGRSYTGQQTAAPIVNIGDLPPPSVVTAEYITADDYALITWTDNAVGLDTISTFTGYFIYRDTVVIGFVTAGAAQFRDFDAFPGQFTYAVSKFRIMPDGETVESAVTAATSPVLYFNVQIPSGFAVSATPLTTYQQVDLTWDRTTASNAAGYIINKDGVEIARLPVEQNTFADIATIEGGEVYSLQVYRDFFGFTFAGSAITIPVGPAGTYASILPAPTDVTTVGNYPNGAKICWVYDDFIPAEFIIYKDDIAVDTLNTEARAYYDYNIGGALSSSYAVQAIYDGPLSPTIELSATIGATEIYNKRVLITGQIVETTTRMGIPFGEVLINQDGGDSHYAGRADATGFFVIDVPRWSTAPYDLVVEASPAGCFDCVQTIINVLPYQDVYHDVELAYTIGPAQVDEPLALVENIGAFTDVYTMSNVLHLSMTSDAWDGIDIIKGIEPLPSIAYGDKTTFIDAQAVPGITYKYIFTPYRIMGNVKVKGADVDIDVTTASLLAVENLRATASRRSNSVTVEWAHVYNNATSYIVLRNGVLLREVAPTEALRVLDTTGISGERYEYQVYARLDRGGAVYLSDPRSATVIYPELSIVDDLVAEIAYEVDVAANETDVLDTLRLNDVVLSWAYTDKATTGFKIYRDGDFIAQVGDSIMTYTDNEGIPGLQTIYAVSAIVERAGQVKESDLLEVDIVFPLVSQATNVIDSSRTSLGDMQVRWDYPAGSCAGFAIYRVVGSTTTLIANITTEVNSSQSSWVYIDRSYVPAGTIQRYQVKAYQLIDGIEYNAVPQITATPKSYPGPPEVGNADATDHLSQLSEIVSWSLDRDAFYDDIEIVVQRESSFGPIIATYNVPRGITSYKLELPLLVTGFNVNLYYKIRTRRQITSNSFWSSGEVGAVSLRTVSTTSIGDYVASNVIASKGTLTDTKIEWNISCSFCDPSNESFYIWRDTVLIGIVGALEDEFFDSPNNLVAGAPEAIRGKEYIYEITSHDTYDLDNSNIAGDIGWSSRNGRIEGFVYAQGTTDGVPNVAVTATGTDPLTGSLIIGSATSLPDGSYTIDGLYYGSDFVAFDITASFLDHAFDLPDTVIVSTTSSTAQGVVLFDLNATIVTGRVAKEDAICGLEGITIYYRNNINGIISTVDSVLTDANGLYSFVVNPFVDDLDQIIIEAGDIERYSRDDGSSGQILHDFGPAIVFTSPMSMPDVSIVDFEDVLRYSTTITIVNACGDPVSDQMMGVRLYTADGCYDQEVTTNVSGIATVDLLPYNYEVVVTDIFGGGVTNYENAAKNYLQLRPTKLGLLADHIAADGGLAADVEALRLVYHVAPTIQTITDYDRYLCDDPTQPAIIEQGETYNVAWIVTETHLGQTCEIQDGYLIVRNAGASQVVSDSLINTGSGFPDYSFDAGSPNLIAPHVHDMTIQLFNNDGIFQASTSSSLIVEGSTQLPGTGIQTTADSDGGDINLPLFILRDPPGDGSSSTIEAGTTVQQSIQLDKGNSGSFGFYADTKAGVGVAVNLGGFFETTLLGGRETNDAYSYDIGVTTTQSYSTSSSNTGRGAGVIVGSGLSTQYGLQRTLAFEDDCTPLSGTVLAFGIGGFESEYIYTVDFIEDIIEDYTRDIQLIGDGLLTVIDSDGSELAEALAVQQFTVQRSGWEEIIRYFDYETVPHYLLCADEAYLNELSESGQTLYAGWQTNFCSQIGTGVGASFVMDDEITWTPDLINSYNNTIAYTEAIKETPAAELLNSNLQLSGKEITQGELLLTQQFHSLLGSNVRTAEIKDVSGGSGGVTATLATQQSSQSSFNVNRFFTSSTALGFYLNAEQSVVGSQIVDSELKIGVAFETSSTVGSTRSDAEESTSTISYTIEDDDAEDQVTTLVIQGPMQNQTPYFIRLGGQSSCPAEQALTPNQDNDPLQIDDPGILVITDPTATPVSTTPAPPPLFFITEGQAGIYTVRITNSSATSDTRDVEVFLDQNTNPLGAIIKLGGTNLNNGSKLITDILPLGAIDQVLTIERPQGTPFYDFEAIRIGARPACGGSAEFIEFSVYFQSPCSPVSLSSPESGFVVNRANPNDLLDRETIRFELRDYQSNNPNLQEIQVQYRRVGAPGSWLNVPGAIFSRADLAAADATIVPGDPTAFAWEWDITGQYGALPDGDYALRARSFCGTSGILYSNNVEGVLDRAALKNSGFPEPADGILVAGDEISASYITDIDCAAIAAADSIGDFLRLYDVTADAEVPFTYTCIDNKVVLIPDGLLSDLDDHILQASYLGISNLSGNIAPDITWSFRVITQEVDWLKDGIQVSVIEGDTVTLFAEIINTTASVVASTGITTQLSWVSATTQGPTSIPPGGQIIALTIIADQPVGVYTDTVSITGLIGRIPALPLTIHVVERPVTPLIDPSLTDSMRLNVNWRFVDDLVNSTDTLDVIYALVDGEVRGLASIEQVGPFYVAQMDIFGNELIDQGRILDFAVYNADEALTYTTVPFADIAWQNGTFRGTVAQPEILLVADDTTTINNIRSPGIIYVDWLNVSTIQDGSTWTLAFDDLQEALAIAQPLDTIWMAQGQYYPSAIGDRSATFTVGDSIAIYGGFVVGDLDLTDRDTSNRTVLNGDIGIVGDSLDNTYHVLTVTGDSVRISTLQVTEGLANGLGSDGLAGGLRNYGSLRLDHVEIDDCQALMPASHLYNEGTITIDHVKIKYDPVTSSLPVVNTSDGALIIRTGLEVVRE